MLFGSLLLTSKELQNLRCFCLFCLEIRSACRTLCSLFGALQGCALVGLPVP